MRRTLMLLICLVLLTAGAADAGSWAHVRFHSYWGPYTWGPHWSWYYHWWGPRVFVQLRDNNLAAVDTDIRPERARLYLDGKLIGLADDFDGNPDYLYLSPGTYQLEAQLGGFTTEKIEIVAEDNQVYQLDFKMQRIPSEPKEKRSALPQLPRPVTRRFQPSQEQPAAAAAPQPAARARRGPDLSLRPDLASRQAPAQQVPGDDARAASLSLQISPDDASVYLDGAFVGTAAQLAAMEGLAVKPGRHVVEVLAPGLKPQRRAFDIGAGESIRLELALQPGE